MRRPVIATFLALLASLALAGTALATDCTNASKKDPASGAQLVLGPNNEVIYISPGLAKRVENGLVDFDSGEGFHGQLALDVDGDGVADFSTWFGVGPDGTEIPIEAQLRGPACRGLTSIGIYFTQCVGP
jgi:hypothetical protein